MLYFRIGNPDAYVDSADTDYLYLYYRNCPLADVFHACAVELLEQTSMATSMQEEEILCLLYLDNSQNKKKRRRARKWCVRPLNGTRTKDGEFSMLVQEMRAMDEEKHHQYFRMSAGKFDFLASIIGERIQHQRTHSAPISVAKRLAVTLRYLATGCSQVGVAADWAAALYRRLFPKCARPFGTLCRWNLSPSHPRHSGWT